MNFFQNILLSKRFWEYVMWAAVLLGLAAFIVDMYVLFQIYGCAGPNLQAPTHGLCSKTGLKAVNTFLHVLQGLIAATLVVGMIARVMRSRLAEK